jgi:hypothetical protein
MTPPQGSGFLRRAAFGAGLLAVVTLRAGAQGTCSASIGSPCTITVPAPNATAISIPRVVYLVSLASNVVSWSVTVANLDAGQFESAEWARPS